MLPALDQVRLLQKTGRVKLAMSTAELEKGHVHLSKQGDVELYSGENLLRRELAKLDAGVIAAVDKFWATTHKTVNSARQRAICCSPLALC